MRSATAFLQLYLELSVKASLYVCCMLCFTALIYNSAPSWHPSEKRRQRVQPLQTKLNLLVPEIRQSNGVKNIIHHLQILGKMALYRKSSRVQFCRKALIVLQGLLNAVESSRLHHQITWTIWRIGAAG